VTGPSRRFRGRDACVQPERDCGVPEVVRTAR
jgi:hypothetical protein